MKIDENPNNSFENLSPYNIRLHKSIDRWMYNQWNVLRSSNNSIDATFSPDSIPVLSDLIVTRPVWFYTSSTAICVDFFQYY